MSPARPAGSVLAEIDSIPRDGDEPVFPAPWAATAFAMTVALHERGHFTWTEWAVRLGKAVENESQNSGENPETYWRCWLSALEETISSSGIGEEDMLKDLRAAWRKAAAATPHGEPVVLSDHVNDLLQRKG